MGAFLDGHLSWTSFSTQKPGDPSGSLQLGCCHLFCPSWGLEAKKQREWKSGECPYRSYGPNSHILVQLQGRLRNVLHLCFWRWSQFGDPLVGLYHMWEWSRSPKGIWQKPPMFKAKIEKKDTMKGPRKAISGRTVVKVTEDNPQEASGRKEQEWVASAPKSRSEQTHIHWLSGKENFLWFWPGQWGKATHSFPLFVYLPILVWTK